MENSKNEMKSDERSLSKNEDLEDLDLFIEKRKIQNEALKKLIPEKEKKQKNKDK